MIARSALPAEFACWNGATGAPCSGTYAYYYGNSATRMWEYPWVFSVLSSLLGIGLGGDHGPEMKEKPRILEIGGGISGFAVSLARAGSDVTVIDPQREGTEPGRLIERFAAAHGVQIQTVEGTAEGASLPAASFDAACCLSVIEHILDPPERASLMRGVHRLLKPGAHFVITLDLLLNLQPFTDRPNEPGNCNVLLPELMVAAPFALVGGDPQELYGMPGFSADSIRERAHEGEFLVSGGRFMSQCFVLRALEQAR